MDRGVNMGIVVFFLIIAAFCFLMSIITLRMRISQKNNIANYNNTSGSTSKSSLEYTIVGVTHSHFGNHAQIAFQDLSIGEPLFLYADENNKYDSCAVVIKTYDDKYVGWLPKGSKEIYDKILNDSDNITAILSDKYVLYDDDNNEKTYRGKTMYGGNIKINIY